MSRRKRTLTPVPAPTKETPCTPPRLAAVVLLAGYSTACCESGFLFGSGIDAIHNLLLESLPNHRRTYSRGRRRKLTWRRHPALCAARGRRDLRPRVILRLAELRQPARGLWDLRAGGAEPAAPQPRGSEVLAKKTASAFDPQLSTPQKTASYALGPPSFQCRRPKSGKLKIDRGGSQRTCCVSGSMSTIWVRWKTGTTIGATRSRAPNRVLLGEDNVERRQTALLDAEVCREVVCERIWWLWDGPCGGR